jgi:AcrR family transcriptional regulator
MSRAHSANANPHPGDAAPETAALPLDHHQRVLDGLAEVLEHKAYAAATIADIVAAARVSKRTFYEHFDTKQACLLALCEHLSTDVLTLIAAGYDPDADWVVQLQQVTRAYLGHLQTRPALLRALYLELLAIGPAGLAVRRRIGQRFELFLMMQVELSRLREPDKRPLSAALAAAVVGGINELILQAIEEGRSNDLVALSDTVTEFVQAVLKSLEAT